VTSRTSAWVRRATRSAALAVPPIKRLIEQRDQLLVQRDTLVAERASLGANPTGTGTSIRIEYPVTPVTRDWSATTGGIALNRIIADGDDRYRTLLTEATSTAATLQTLDVEAPADPATPNWDNGWLPPLDGLFLAHFLLTRRPSTYLEIGSGNSTKFARFAIEAGGLDTRIVSIDPQPRAEIDLLCDQVIRAGLESDATAQAFRDLGRNDVVFFDGSHYCFQNSDVTVFFIELLAALPSGCVYGIHDIVLPDDYPPQWNERYYNEQYMLASWVLGGAAGDQIVLPASYVSTRPQFDDARAALITAAGADAAPEHHGGAFWMQRA
jgi:hypothetical protein